MKGLNILKNVTAGMIGSPAKTGRPGMIGSSVMAGRPGRSSISELIARTVLMVLFAAGLTTAAMASNADKNPDELADLLHDHNSVLVAAIPVQDTTEADREYYEFVENWHKNRIERLHDDRGWLRLAGLYWLDEGEQSFGSGPYARVRFPESSIPEMAGIFEVREDTVFMRVVGNIDIRDEHDHRVRDGIISTPEMTKELTYRTLYWFVVRRDDLVGIRLFDDNSPHLRHFDGIERYDIDKDWRVEARFEPREQGATMLIENVLGQMIEWDVAGTLTFSAEGHEVSIVALGTGDRLFIPFADATSGSETYPGGRFLYIDRPSPGEPAIVDFNVSYNPPCAINPHTTCPLPPPQNRMPFPIRAGEKHYEMYHE